MTTLLLVEDDADMREPLRLLLECAGYRVIVAEHGAAALAAMTGLSPDAVVTDWWMPVMDGVALCRCMRRESQLASVSVVLMSASSPPSVDPSWDVFLSKPVSIDQIEQALHGLLGSSKDGRIGEPGDTGNEQ
ncbi:response regulator [Paraburkholderia phenoliruptrix]|uniref:Two-component system sensor histidine kinase protein n=2 Tax=Paraburkholderia phenoliruptrix TaxID=252970 RepID=K0E0P6_9BURK|nr:response regulator [Paraburkholderia phenoliruptrix]AFT90028.1 two-component system sensor histidine kinase protein [Paraburkholderia phenoliruptrix BR3459a]CAB4052495.1 Response regulator MprA [Paraburkholderia phenoliruptrix]